ncbi:MAG: RDJLphi1 gp43 [Rhodoferax sp.]|nr:RDJLphi1 gp43 [Rhodoferax sp.]
MAGSTDPCNQTAIWKFPVQVADEQTVMIPGGARILTVAVQAGTVCLWAEVCPGHSKRPRTLRIYGTGHPMPGNPGIYISTFMLQDGALVFHAYEAPQ